MRFKTVIKLVSDAKNKNEALEVVEEYLAGNIVSGVDVKCVTRPLHNKTKIAGASALVFMIVISAFLFCNIKHTHSIIPLIPGVNAVQPPLNTASITNKSENFKKDWEDRRTKESLAYITK